MNPLLESWSTPFGTPPFERIKTTHFKPAIIELIKIAGKEVNKIANSSSHPDFNNTVESLEKISPRLGEVTAILFNLNSAETNIKLQLVAQEISPLLTRFSNDITLNEKLFGKVRYIYDNQANLSLDIEQRMLLKDRYRSFLRGGAGLSRSNKKRFRQISEELSGLTLSFDENVLEETNQFELHLRNKEDIGGLPRGLVDLARAEAETRNLDGWIFTLHSPSYVPFMQYSDKRELRKKMYRAYTSRAFKGNERDNSELVRKITALRLEMAKLLGYNNYAEYILEDRMANSPEKVNIFLEDLFEASLPNAKNDFKEVSEFARESGFKNKLERWDWAYYSEKLKKSSFDIDDETLKPYFQLENVQNAIFNLAETLYGLKFLTRADIPVYHDEVKTFEVRDKNDEFLAIFYLDYHPRKGKNGGAWMTAYREQYKDGENDIRPLISIVCNFSKANKNMPALMTLNELTTFLHEFGHALHGILSKCKYLSLSGTNVSRDFVELPSQIMENWAYEKEWLDTWAKHYDTGETISKSIILKIKKSLIFNEGYACNRQLSFGILDMAWHSIGEPVRMSVKDFENKAMKKTEFFRKVESSNMSCSFSHLFSGGYAAGYYGYKWAEVLDADAFALFTRNGIMDSKTAESFRKNILEKGATEEPMNLYINFRGKEPDMKALLVRSGFIKE